MAISRPRTSRQPRWFKPVRLVFAEFPFVPAAFAGARLAPPAAEARLLILASPVKTASPLTRAPTGNSPISASAVMVLPLPDSPTTPSDSPAAMRSDTSFTGRTQPDGVGNSTFNPRTSSRSAMYCSRVGPNRGIGEGETVRACLGETLRLTSSERHDKLQRGMGGRKAYDFHVFQTGLAASGEDVD